MSNYFDIERVNSDYFNLERMLSKSWSWTTFKKF